MSWTNWPVSASTNVQLWNFYFEALTAVRERMFASGLSSYPAYPRTNIIWDSAVVSAISNTTVTLSKSPTYSDHYWITRPAPAPATYDVVIDNPDPSKIIRAQITDNTGNVLAVSSLADYPTTKFISSLSDVVGQTAYIIRHGGLWWSDRIIQWGNEGEYEVSSTTASTTSTITDSTKSWTKDQYNGYHLIIFGGGSLRRIPITATNGSTITFGTQSFTPSGSYIIVAANKKCDLSRIAGYLLSWYGHSSGAEDSLYSHRPNDTIGITVLPSTTVDVNGTPVNCFDTDVWSDKDSVTRFGDDCYTPNLFKSYRQLQVDLERLCDYFVEKKTYDGATAIELFTVATAFYKAGINAYKKTATCASGSVTFTLNSLPYSGVGIHFCILDDLGNRVLWGEDTPGSTTFTRSVGTQYNGKTMELYVTYGWTRFFPKEILHMYDRYYFIPDSSGVGSVYSTPIDADPGCGTWITRNKSTNYRESSEQGDVTAGGVAYADGDVVRYCGDNFNDPTLGGVAFELLDWEDPAYEGTYNDSHQATYESSLVGIATSGGTNYLTASAKDWYNVYPMTGVLRTETGTASGGTGTTLSDSSKSTSHFWDTSKGRWNGFILEITKAVGGAVYKTPITGTSGTTLTFVAVSGLTVTAGDTYKIREPKSVLNRWKGRKIEITRKADSSVHTLDILYNDDNTIWFSPQSFSVADGDRFRIIEYKFGDVLKRTSDVWNIATGVDPRGPNFVSFTKGNLPHNIKRYGRIHKGDYFGYHIYDELYKLINTLAWTRGNPTWTSRANPAVAEKNARDTSPSPGTSLFINIPEPDLANAKSIATTGWSDNWHAGHVGDTYEVSLPPHASSVLTWDDFEDWSGGPPPAHIDNYGALADRCYAYGVLAGLPFVNMAKNVEWYAWAEITSGADNASSSDPFKFTFSAEGDDVAFRQFSLWDTTSMTSTQSTTQSIALGSRDTQPSWGPNPSSSYPTYTSTASKKGYYVTRQYCVLKWDIPGGFTKY